MLNTFKYKKDLLGDTTEIFFLISYKKEQKLFLSHHIDKTHAWIRWENTVEAGGSIKEKEYFYKSISFINFCEEDFIFDLRSRLLDHIVITGKSKIWTQVFW